MTDSGGLQEETTGFSPQGVSIFSDRFTRSGKKLKKPLRVLRDFAVQHIRVGTTKEGIVTAFEHFKNGFRKEGKVPELWDGKAAERIVDKLISLSTKK